MAIEFRRQEEDTIRSSFKMTEYFCPMTQNFDFLDRFPKKSANIKFHGNPYSGSLADTRGQMDAHGEGNRRLSWLSESA